jgi:hypothetical protein
MHFDQFRRREFITLLGGATAVTRGAFAGAIRSTGFGRDAQTVKDRARKR